MNEPLASDTEKKTLDKPQKKPFESVRFIVGSIFVGLFMLVVIIYFLFGYFTQTVTGDLVGIKAIWCLACTLFGFGCISLQWWDTNNSDPIKYFSRYGSQVIIIASLTFILGEKYLSEGLNNNNEKPLTSYLIGALGIGGGLGYYIDSVKDFFKIKGA